MDKYNKHRFRLISPIVGNKIYSSSSVKHVAKKCIDELRSNIQVGGKKYTKFAILDIDNYTTYKFNINYHQKTHNHNLPLNGSLFGTQNNLNGGSNEIINKINKLEERVTNLENNIKKIQNNENNENNENDENDENDENEKKSLNGGNLNHSSHEKKTNNELNHKSHSEQPYMS